MLARLRSAARKDESGFTLIELLVVMIIIGILAAIAIPTFLNQRKNGYRTAEKTDIRNAVTAIESWAVEQGGSYTGLTTAKLTGTTATDINFVASKDVNISISTAVPVTATVYCIETYHNSIGSTEKWSYKRGTDNEPKQQACA